MRNGGYIGVRADKALRLLGEKGPMRMSALLCALEAIEVCATSCRKGWKGRTPPTMEEVDDAIRKLSYCVGTLKDYRSIRIQLEKEKEEEE